MSGRRTVAGAFLVALVAVSCGGGDRGTAQPDTEPTAVSTVAEPEPEPPATTEPVDEPQDSVIPDDTVADEEPDDVEFDIEAVLARDPLVIFNAYPPKPDHITYELPPGQRDFFELWEPGAPWQTALEHVDVYRLHAFQMRHFLDDDQLVALIEFLRDHDIPLMFETEPLVPPDPEECAHAESYEAPWDLEMAVRLKELGGQIDIIAIEEPYHFAHLLDTPEACQYSVERVVDEVLQHVGNLRELFGDIPVGTIEPIWSSPQTEPRDMEIWLDTFEAMAGEPFAFLHVDPNWYRADWAEVAVGIEAVADARGVPFGVLYNGGAESDGLSWMNFTMANAAELEIGHGATPQHVSFQSWVPWPDHSLPEDDLTALTSGIVRYFGERVVLSVEDTADGLVVRAEDLDGQPIEGVRLRAHRDGGEQTVATQTVRSVVPDGATEALILVRANAEAATPGTAAATLHEVSFSDGAGGPNLVPNGDFANGTEQWGVYGSGAGGVGVVDAGSDLGLAVRAATGQDIYIDGATFPVSAGSPFDLSVTYRLDGGDPDTVVVAVEFTGISRANIFVHDLPSDLGEFVTDSDGTALVPREIVGAGPATVVVTTDGDLDHWPATASVQIG